MRVPRRAGRVGRVANRDLISASRHAASVEEWPEPRRDHTHCADGEGEVPISLVLVDWGFLWDQEACQSGARDRPGARVRKFGSPRQNRFRAKVHDSGKLSQRPGQTRPTQPIAIIIP